MTRAWIVLAALNAFLAVAAGAYAAHGLAADPMAQGLADKASRYQMTHALALLAVAWMGDRWPSRLALASGLFFLLGILLFCGTLYAMALAGLGWSDTAPYGGTSFLLGWLALGLHGAWKAR